MQEVQLKQWVDIDGVITRVDNIQGRVPEGITKTPLYISFDISNTTGMILTLNWVLVRIDGKRQKPQFFKHPLNPSSDAVTINTSVLLEDDRLDAYRQYKLGVSTDAFNKLQKQHFSCLCVCGPPASTRTSPLRGTIPEDDIEESDRT